MEGDKLKFPSRPIMGRGDKTNHDGQTLGNNFYERRAEVAILASQLSAIVSEARVAFFCASSNLLINLGTRGSSDHHRCMMANMVTKSARSIPPLYMVIRSRRSLGSTRV